MKKKTSKSPNSIFKLKYPKFILLLITYFIAFLIFHYSGFNINNINLPYVGYFTIFVLGILYAFSLSAGPATAFLLLTTPNDAILVTSLIVGFGALIADLFIFKFIRFSFDDEIRKLSQETWLIKMRDAIPSFFRNTIIPIISFIIIASPLPDEIGVTLLATCKKISTSSFIITAYLLNTAGIFVILSVKILL